MTLLLPTIIYSTFNTFIKIMDIAAYTTEYIEQELPCELISWLSYLFFPAIIAILSSFHIVVSGFTAIPIYFWTLVWHPDGRSILDMLRNPEGCGRLIRYDNDRNRHHWRERHTVILFCWQFVLLLFVLQSLAFSARQNT